MSEHRFRQLDQAWERSQAYEKPDPGFHMNIRWFRRACDGELQFLGSQHLQRRSWRALNAFLATRLRVTPRNS